MNGGKDLPDNMQWLAHSDHKSKTKRDLAACKDSYLCKNKRLKKKLPWNDQANKARRDHDQAPIASSSP